MNRTRIAALIALIAGPANAPATALVMTASGQPSHMGATGHVDPSAAGEGRGTHLSRCRLARDARSGGRHGCTSHENLDAVINGEDWTAVDRLLESEPFGDGTEAAIGTNEAETLDLALLDPFAALLGKAAGDGSAGSFPGTSSPIQSIDVGGGGGSGGGGNGGGGSGAGGGSPQGGAGGASGALAGFDNAPAVPEPATWAMMLFGFAIVGGAMRSRQKQNVAVRYG